MHHIVRCSDSGKLAIVANRLHFVGGVVMSPPLGFLENLSNMM